MQFWVGLRMHEQPVQLVQERLGPRPLPLLFNEVARDAHSSAVGVVLFDLPVPLVPLYLQVRPLAERPYLGEGLLTQSTRLSMPIPLFVPM